MGPSVALKKDDERKLQTTDKRILRIICGNALRWQMAEGMRQFVK